MDIFDNRVAAAEKCFSEYNFDDEVVKEADGWECLGDVFQCSIYFENGDNPSIKKTFVVKFKPYTAEIMETYL